MTREQRVPRKRTAYEPVGRLLTPTSYDPAMKRPNTIVAGVVLVVLRVVAGVWWLVDVGLHWGDYIKDASITIDDVAWSPELVRDSFAVFAAITGVVLLIDAMLALLVFRGVNVARVIVMGVSVVSITSSFVAWWLHGQEITIHTTFLSLALDILVLLALSSRSAAAYARRNEHPESS